MKKKISRLRVVTHRNNQGYGGALLSGFGKARMDFIFYTDSDGQYDVSELKKLVTLMGTDVDMVTGFKLNRSDPWYRKLIGTVYNKGVKILLRLHVKDIDCDFRLFRRSILHKMHLKMKSGAFDAEFIKEIEQKHVRIKEVGVNHYKRSFGKSKIFNVRKIIRSIGDVGWLFFHQASL